jgi:general secretion pathway protein A
MYERYYGLKEKPFSLTPDPEFLFLNKHFRGALDNVIYGIQRQEGFTTIVGDVGTGKTTLCWALLSKLDKSIRTALILNPLLSAEDMLRAILQDFGVKPKHHGWTPETSDVGLPYDPSWMQGLTKKDLIDELNYFLLAGLEQGVFNILIVDEAQNLSLEVLEQLRILSNLETAKKKLIQIIFVGQLEFEQKLHLPQLRQLDQRITIRYALKPLSKKDMVQYIEHRLSVAGSRGGIGFTQGALRNIYEYSKGYPRLINVICDRTLLAGYSERARVITARMTRKAARGIRGKETGTRIRFIPSMRLIVPIAALLVLALLAALFLWLWRGSLADLRANFKRSMSSPASTKQVPDPLSPAIALVPESPGAFGAHTPDSPHKAAEHAKDPIPEANAQTRPLSLITTTSAATREPAASRALSVKDPPPEHGPAEGSGRYLLQLHSLETKEQADAAVADLQKKGYFAFVKLEEAPKGKQWFVVYAGPYDSLKRALEQASMLKAQQNLSPIVRH